MKKGFRIIGKVALYAVGIAAVTVTIAHFAWKYSGDGQWELWRDKKGVAIYTKKVSGNTKLQFKVITRVNTSMDRIVAAMTDTTTEGCRHFITGCVSGQIFKAFDEKDLSYVQAYRIPMAPMSDKDLAMVLKMQLSQDPRTKTVQMDVSSLPELVPDGDCCVRMGAVANQWRFTPVGNGQIELQFTENVDAPLPYWMYNRYTPIGHTWMRRNAQRTFDSAKYRNAEFAFLRQG